MKKTLIIIASLAFLSGCMKEVIDLEKVNSDSFDPSFAIPIGNVTLKLDRLNDQANRFLKINPTTGVFEFIYQSDAVELNFGDLFNMPNQNVSTTTSMSSSQVSAFNLVPLGSTYGYSNSNVGTFTLPSSEQLDSLIIKNGSLDINVSSTYTHDISIVLIIPSLLKNGAVFDTTILLNYTATTPVTGNINLLLAGYTLDLTDAGFTNNTLRFNYNITLTKGALPATTSESISFNSWFTFSDLEVAHGYFGNRIITESDTLEYDLFKNSFGGTVSIADPRIDLEYINSSGLSFRANFNSISAPENTINQNIGGPGLTSMPTIAKANFVGDSTITYHTIDNNNTTPTITDILNELPTKLAFSASIELNPGGVTKNFISENSKLRARTKLTVPLNGRADGFSLTDTNSTVLEQAIGIDSSDAENLKKVTIRLQVTNGLPISSSIQAYFLDSNNTLLDSLFSGGIQSIFGAGIVNFSVPTTDINYGRVITPAKRSVDIIMTKDQYLSLIVNKQSKLVYKVKFNTIGSSTLKDVKFFPEDYVDLKLSAKVDLTISL